MLCLGFMQASCRAMRGFCGVDAGPSQGLFDACFLSVIGDIQRMDIGFVTQGF